jgi:hypothetical protein
LPIQVDKSLLIEWGIAAGNESGLLTSLKALALIDDDGRPTELYREIRLSQPRRVAALRRSAELGYPGLSSTGGRLDDDQLYDYFVEQRGLTGQMVDKAIRFYRQLDDSLQQGGGTAEPESPRRGVSPIRPNPIRPAPTTVPVPPIPRLSQPVVLTPEPDAAPRAGGGEVGITVVVQVSPTSSENELADLFRRVRRAWKRSREDLEE